MTTLPRCVRISTRPVRTKPKTACDSWGSERIAMISQSGLHQAPQSGYGTGRRLRRCVLIEVAYSTGKSRQTRSDQLALAVCVAPDTGRIAGLGVDSEWVTSDR